MSYRVVGSGGPSLLLPRFPHRTRRPLSTILYGFTLSVLSLLLIAALLGALYDVAQQFIKSSRESKVSDIVITFGTYVVIVLIGTIIWLTRKLSLRSTFASIPKAYLPTKHDDVPKAAFELLTNEFDRASVISCIAQPKGRQQGGWGRPGTDYENVHFRKAILNTIPVLNETIALYPHLHSSSSPRAAPLSPLAPLLALSSIPGALLPLAELYEQYLTKAKYGQAKPTEGDWESCLKIVAVFIGVLGSSGGVPKTAAGVGAGE